MSRSETSPDDARFMGAALALARRGLGRVAPNPAVGCVIVNGGRVVGRGWTQPGGRPHAETEALGRAGDAARGATAFVTLEPCSHAGRTGPCADALVAAGIARAVVALEDPDTRVSGRGLARMRDAGLAVETGLMGEAAAALNRGFLLHRTERRPLVTLKLATSLDGRIATASGESRWITGPAARSDAHLLRMTHDAVLVGIGTVLADDPALTCRLPGVGAGELRVVLDGRGRLPAGSKLCDGDMPTLQIVAEDCGAPAPDGVGRIAVPAAPGGGVSIADTLRALAGRGVTRMMVEGGGRVAAAFLRAALVDRLVWYRAGMALGGGGRPGIADLGPATLAEMPRFRLVESRALGHDRVDVLER